MATFIQNPPDIGLAKSSISCKFWASSEALLMEVWIEKVWMSGDFEFAFESKMIPDSANQVHWYIGNRLKSFLSLSLPNIDDHSVQSITGPILRYKIRHAEKGVGDLVHEGDYYHEDYSGSAPDYYESLALDIDATSGSSYLVISDSIDFDKVDGVNFQEKGGSSATGLLTRIKGAGSYGSTVVALTYDCDEIRMPAGVTFSIYRNDVTYIESEIFSVLLAGVSKKSDPLTFGKTLKV